MLRTVGHTGFVSGSGGRLLDELSAAVRYGANADELARELSRGIQPAVAHDAMRLVATSPAVRGLPSAFSFWCGYEPGLGGELLRGYYSGDDPCLPGDLVRRTVPAGVLGAGDGRRDRLARELLSAHGAGGELRVLLRDARGTWGLLALLRSEGGRPFDAGDACAAARLSAVLIDVLRRYATAGPLAPPGLRPPPGVWIIGADDAIRSATPQAAEWRERYRASTPEWLGMGFLTGLAMQTRAHADSPLVIAPAAGFGRWAAFRGQRLGGGAEVVLIAEPAAGAELLPVFCDWYGITARERQIIGHLREARAPKQIARCLDMSVHTVNDHLKAVFRKTGASGRDELLAAIAG